MTRLARYLRRRHRVNVAAIVARCPPATPERATALRSSGRRSGTQAQPTPEGTQTMIRRTLIAALLAAAAVIAAAGPAAASSSWA